ncbi:hypothetical protein CfE428DRAFT_1151 [Chthoniobacter flavus Ellin428]|uniref:Uncharacterized protein n=1 Tax=Chthoniobacter flavus Ellin428 TaxID=497964 RepID=B4CX60_9BACT|nr:hypothetical protein [Chthoniobacter flavus]EDY20858.1 hypothetical protein CfE428DRAFT_1151 [Chthoniobacter flavus Ellin428]TCO85650.1 hypothetical protein EV701_13033 [Chthoniobacter flavus]
MKHRPICYLLVSLCLVSSAPAQNTGPTAAQLESMVTIRRQRVDLVREEMRQTDAHIESRLDTLIRTLTSITDSKDSRTKVARMKEDTMKGLSRTIGYYDQKRAKFIQDLRNPQTQLDTAEKEKAIAYFDAQIQKRIEQILALKKSMPAHKDYEQYVATGGGWYGTEYRRNQDYEQNQRMVSHVDSQRDAIGKQLDASIARLDRMGRDLRSRRSAISDPAQAREWDAAIARNDTLITERRQQKLEVLQSSNTAQRGVALKEAMDLDKTMKMETDALRRDMTTLFQRYTTFVQELTALHATEKSVAALQRHP